MPHATAIRMDADQCQGRESTERLEALRNDRKNRTCPLLYFLAKLQHGFTEGRRVEALP